MSTYDAYAPTYTPAVAASAADRVTYLRKLAGMTALGLAVTGVTTVISAVVIASLNLMSLGGNIGLMAMILGPWLFANYVCGSMVFSQSTPVKWGGFFMAAIAEGWTFGFLTLTAAALSMDVYGNPLGFLIQGLGLTGLTIFGMVVYLMTGPRELSYVKGFLAIATLPLLIGMVVSFVFPSFFGGPMGILVSLLFVGASAAGLLVKLNETMHKFTTNMHVEGGFLLMMGVLAMLWNIITLLMRLQSRD